MRAAVEDLSRRVSHFERLHGVSAKEEPAPAEEVEAPAEGGDSARLLNNLALICFVLVGALALRTVARQAWISPATGTVCGLVYCLALMLLPRLIWRRRVGPALLLPACGGLLSPLIVLEMTHLGAMKPGAAAAVFAVGAAVGVLVGALQRSAVLTAVVLLAQMGGVVALGLTPEGGVLRGAALVLMAASALAAAQLRGWPFLRPLVLVPVGLALSLGVLLTAQRQPLAAEVTPGLLLSALALLVLLVVNLAARVSRLDAFERACLPVAAVWTYWLAAFSKVPALPVVAGACGVLALVLAWWLGRRRPAPGPYPGLVATGALLLLSVLPWAPVIAHGT